jgi:very-short-patch-repair endonuclease
MYIKINKIGRFIIKGNDRFKNKFDYTKSIWNGCHEKLIIICPKHGEFPQTPTNHLKSKLGCYKCAIDDNIIRGLNQKHPLRLTQEYIIYKCKLTHNNFYDYSKSIFTGMVNKMIIICPILGHGEFLQSPTNHCLGKGCRKCANIRTGKAQLSNADEFIFKSRDIINHIDKNYKYNLVNYINGQTKVIIICPIEGHGEFKQTPDSHLQGHGCPNCNHSKGRVIISKHLKNNEMIFEIEKRFKDCRNILPLPFDFWIEEKNTLIEYDGKQHFEPIEYWGGHDTFKLRQQNDEIKNQYCIDKGINLIRIPYTEFKNIDTILTEKLNLAQKQETVLV